ncbi:MAG: redoxin domain-containing protein [Candidatus Calescibacterium sp.]|nr:redoxin domain-containing protein [Candidatus Calescibacterium sp.]MDW8087875.1 redoxin domain-containing protein [Candidatus Calescibacterium sp.]
MAYIGEKAPEFSVSDIYGKLVRLSVGKKKVLGFLRYIGCPYCQRDIMKMLSKSKNFEKADVILISHSTADVLKKYLEKLRDFPFIMVSDPQKTIYKRYGVEDGSPLDFVNPAAIVESVKTIPSLKDYKIVPGGIDKNYFTRPAFFVIDENNVIIYKYQTKHVADSFDIDEIIAKL